MSKEQWSKCGDCRWKNDGVNHEIPPLLERGDCAVGLLCVSLPCASCEPGMISPDEEAHAFLRIEGEGSLESFVGSGFPKQSDVFPAIPAYPEGIHQVIGVHGLWTKGKVPDEHTFSLSINVGVARAAGVVDDVEVQLLLCWSDADIGDRFSMEEFYVEEDVVIFHGVGLRFSREEDPSEHCEEDNEPSPNQYPTFRLHGFAPFQGFPPRHSPSNVEEAGVGEEVVRRNGSNRVY